MRPYALWLRLRESRSLFYCQPVPSAPRKGGQLFAQDEQFGDLAQKLSEFFRLHSISTEVGVIDSEEGVVGRSVQFMDAAFRLIIYTPQCCFFLLNLTSNGIVQ